MHESQWRIESLLADNVYASVSQQISMNGMVPGLLLYTDDIPDGNPGELERLEDRFLAFLAATDP